MPDPRRKAFAIRFFGAHPARTAGVVLLLLLAGLAEGVGIGALLPLLEIALGTGGRGGGGALGQIVAGLGRWLGLEPGLGVLLGLMVVALSLKAVLRWLAMKRVAYAVAREAAGLRLRLIRALLAARWRHLVEGRAGEISSAVSVEAYRASFAYRRACAAVAAAVQLAVYAALIFLLSWKLALFAIGIGGAIALLLGGLVRASRVAGEAQTAATSALAARFADGLQALKALKGMGRERELFSLLERETRRLEASERGQVLANESLQSFHEPVFAAVLAVGIYGAVTWANQSVPALLLMAFLLQRVAGRFHYLQTELQGMASGEGSYHALDGLARLAESAVERAEGEPPPPLVQGITVADVSFAYEGEEVLSRVSLRIPAGRFVLVVGPSGAGKTTLLDLVLGLERPTAGAVLVDGVPLEQIRLSAWRRMIGYVPQETVLLHDTVAENLGLGDGAIGRSELVRALEAVGAWEFVEALSDGLDTVVGERGWKLSGGQRQRLAIARALVGRPKLLVLDEPTAALDAESAAAIRATLRALRGTVTILAASHDEAFEEDADIVYEIEDGRVCERARGRAAGVRG